MKAGNLRWARLVTERLARSNPDTGHLDGRGNSTGPLQNESPVGLESIASPGEMEISVPVLLFQAIAWEGPFLGNAVIA